MHLQFTPGIWWNVKWNTATNGNRFSYQTYNLNRRWWRLSSQIIFTKTQGEELSVPPPRKQLVKPWFPSSPSGEMTFTTARISVEAIHATSGRRWESMTWQTRPSTVLRAGTPWTVRWPLRSPREKAKSTDCGGECQPGAGSATCPDCACAAVGWQALPARASLLSAWLPSSRQRSRPHRPKSVDSAPRPGVATGGLGRMRRQA